MNTTAARPTNTEPVGAAYDPARNELYLSRDGDRGRVWVHNVANGDVIRYFDVNVAPYFNADAEGLAFSNGVLYMVDAIDDDLVKVLPGHDGLIGGAVTGNDDVITNYDLLQYGQREPEGLDVHPVTGNLWIVSNRVTKAGLPDPMIEVTPGGALVSSVSIAAADPNSAGGLAIAPASNGSGAWNIYIADRGVDNGDDRLENDGELYEFSIDGGGEGTSPTAEFTWSQRSGELTIDFTDTSSGSPTSWSWDFGDGATSTAQNPVHTYAAAGTYSVTLNASNVHGSDDETQSVTVSAAVDPPPPTADNLLLNAGFETDANADNKPDSWKSNKHFTRSDGAVHGGSFAGRWQSTADNGPSSYQPVAVTAGTTYAFSGWVNAPITADSFTFQIKILWRTDSGAISATVVKKFTDDTAGAWQEVTGSAVAPTGATIARVQMVTKSLNTSIYVDDFAFTAAP